MNVMIIRAREFDSWFTVLRAHAPGGPENRKCFFRAQGDVFFLDDVFSCARARSWRAPELGMFFFRAQGRHAAPRQACLSHNTPNPSEPLAKP